MADEQGNAVAKIVDTTVDSIIEAAAIDPQKVVDEFRARRIRRADGGEIASIVDLREVTLGASREVSKEFIATYAKLAASQGFVTGLGGLITLPATVPADVAAYLGWLARTASAIRYSYGFEEQTETGDAQLKLAMLAGAGVTTVTLQGSEILVKQLAKQVMRTPYVDAPIQATLKALAAKIGVQLGHKSFARAVPLVGGVINGSVHGSLVYAAGGRIHTHYRDLATAPDLT